MIADFVDSWTLFRDAYVAGWLLAALLAVLGVLAIARDQIFIGAAVSQASIAGIAAALRAGDLLGAADGSWARSDAFLSGTRRKWMGMPLLSGQELAITILDGLSHLHNPPRIAEYALKRKGDYYFDRAEFDLADDEYSKLLAGFPASPYVPWLTLRRAQAALARFPGIRFDDAALVDGRREEALQVEGVEIQQVEVDGDELLVGAEVVLRVQQELLLPQDGAGLLELHQPEPGDPLAAGRLGEPALGPEPGLLAVNPAMEE